jgi:hypothetical protein
MQGYVFLPWSKILVGGTDTRKRMEKLIIHQMPATLNVEFHRAQHGLSDARTEHKMRRGRRKNRWAHTRSGEEKMIKDAMLTEYHVAGQEITDGALDLLATRLKDNVTILVNRQAVDVTDFRALKNTFGASRVRLIKDTVVLVEDMLKSKEVREAIKTADRIDVISWVDNVAVRNADAAGGQADLRELKVRYGSYTCWVRAGGVGLLGEERKKRIMDMWDAYNAQQLTVKVGTMEYVRKRLRVLSKRFLGFVPPASLICSVQRHHLIDVQQVHCVIRDMLETSDAPKGLRRHMYDQIRVVQSRRGTVESGLVSQSKFAEESTFDSMPVCTCAAAGTEFTRVGGHVCMRGSEYSGRDRIMKKVLNANAGDNVHPVGDLCALKCMIALALQKTAGRMATYCRFPEAMEKEEYYLERAKGCIQRGAQQSRWSMPTGGIAVGIEARDILHVKSVLKGKGLIASVIDKNKASVSILCPVMLHKILTKMYPVGDTYMRVRRTEEGVLEEMAASATTVFGKVIGVIPRGKKGLGQPVGEIMRERLQRLPRAYAFPKEKDLEKGRPIVPYSKHGLKKELKCAAKALLHLVERLENEGVLKTFTLRACTDIAKKIEGFNEDADELEEVSQERKGMILRMHDVKSMFTALPRDQILKAVDDLFELVGQQRWGRNAKGRWVIVPKLKAERNTLTRITSSEAVPDPEIHFAFTFQQIRDILVWDMDHVYFMVGDAMLKQVKGLPMGSPPSPVLANLTCGVGYEKEYIERMGTAGGERIWGVRSMDDVVIVSTYTMGDEKGRLRAVSRLEELKYHVSMELERTDDDTDGWQRYLEGEIRIVRDRMDVRFFNVNSVSLQGNGTCIKPRVQSGASYIPNTIRRSYVYGALKRMQGYGLDPAQMQLQAGRHLIMELRVAGWTGLKQIILGAKPGVLDSGVAMELVQWMGGRE